MSTGFKLLSPGDHVPWFQAPVLHGLPSYQFHTVAGRYVLLLLFGSARIDAVGWALALVRENRSLFDDEKACFFGVTADPADAEQGRIVPELPGIRFFLDYDRKISTDYGASAGDKYRPRWVLLDERLRVVNSFSLDEGEEAFHQLRARLDAPRVESWAPVLLIPNVFEPELCRELIALYDANGGKESGFMRDVGGKTVGMIDHSFKRRRDHLIENEEMRRGLGRRMDRRVAPSLKQAFQFNATRMERYIIACYEAEAGYFKPHRDNTTKGTAHRKFAVTINLNSEDYEGGDLRFPEFGTRTYRAPTGGAIVFSCSLLHEATPVTRGRRFAFLPFLYDEDGARIREENSEHLAEGIPGYRRTEASAAG